MKITTAAAAVIPLTRNRMPYPPYPVGQSKSNHPDHNPSEPHPLSLPIAIGGLNPSITALPLLPLSAILTGILPWGLLPLSISLLTPLALVPIHITIPLIWVHRLLYTYNAHYPMYRYPNTPLNYPNTLPTYPNTLPAYPQPSIPDILIICRLTK